MGSFASVGFSGGGASAPSTPHLLPTRTVYGYDIATAANGMRVERWLPGSADHGLPEKVFAGSEIHEPSGLPDHLNGSPDFDVIKTVGTYNSSDADMGGSGASQVRVTMWLMVDQEDTVLQFTGTQFAGFEQHSGVYVGPINEPMRKIGSHKTPGGVPTADFGGNAPLKLGLNRVVIITDDAINDSQVTMQWSIGGGATVDVPTALMFADEPQPLVCREELDTYTLLEGESFCPTPLVFPKEGQRESFDLSQAVFTGTVGTVMRADAPPGEVTIYDGQKVKVGAITYYTFTLSSYDDSAFQIAFPDIHGHIVAADHTNENIDTAVISDQYMTLSISGKRNIYVNRADNVDGEVKIRVVVQTIG